MLALVASAAAAAALSAQRRTGVSFLPAETVERAEAGNKIEQGKLKKDPTNAWTDLYDFAAKIRAGELDYSEIEDFDINSRLKWTGLLSRFRRTPGRFMMRLRIPNGIVQSKTLRLFADTLEPYGPDLGVADITTRQNLQLRGLTLEDGAALTEELHASHNLTSFQSALDNARNVVGSPLAGLDDVELVDTRPIANAINDLISLDRETGLRGNPVWGNLPRKFNIAISGGRDDFSHTYINDIGLEPCRHGATGEVGFNVVVGGYMSIKRVAESVPLDLWVPADAQSAYDVCEAILRIFRDEGNRKDRQKARLMWLVEDKGVEAFRAAVAAEIAGLGRGTAVDEAQPHDDTGGADFQRRELLGVHAQADASLRRVGVHVPAGRLSVEEMRHVADLADRYSAGEVRMTVEQNLILPNVAAAEVEALLAEPALTLGRLSVDPGNVVGPMVSCTGAQFCPLAIVETKSVAERVMAKVDALVEADRPIRVHWTGCPNSCGQVQAADIGLMGAPAKREIDGKMKAVAGAKIFLGGTIGEGGHLAMEESLKGVPIDDEDEIAGVIAGLMKEHFGARDRAEAPVLQEA
eukprot:CAMPEP_0119272306 /NCGR_PEP_ID=MMETSP1329-20130426/8534_1 /TAXON_ID=114041 /ORGANISM="Genus nov. species nov., Strain RCC1024" /LENGTH=579 /DNA_ID=CAMNT_0007272369 /DNA_START=216 /DNA_END=1955 /DNA_ORIENTATION=-